MTRAEAGGSIGMSRRRRSLHRDRLLNLFIVLAGSLLWWWGIAYLAVRAWQLSG